MVVLDFAQLGFAVAEVLHREQGQFASSDLAGYLAVAARGPVVRSSTAGSIAGVVGHCSTGAAGVVEAAETVGVAPASVLVGPSSVAGHLGSMVVSAVGLVVVGLAAAAAAEAILLVV